MQNQQERLIYLINYMLDEQGIKINIPQDENKQKILLRELMNIRKPLPINDDFLKIQDEYLQIELNYNDIKKIDDMKPVKEHIYLWQGDITLLQVDAIVNAANSSLLGCFIPNHRCIDNAIHSKAGIQLRLECSKIMDMQNKAEKEGLAKITKAYNLPAKYVIHTVGPKIDEYVTTYHCNMLASCYKSCLEIAVNNNLKSIAFCCISTGEFNFPNQQAAEIAVNEIKNFLKTSSYEIDIIFNVFKDIDYEIYKQLLI